MTIAEPFGQADLRRILLQALDGSARAAAPEVQREDGRRVFQYLGTIERPARIALAGLRGRVEYDFRSDRFRSGSGDWRPPGALNPANRTEFLELVWTWERMMLARQAAAAGE